MKDDNNNSKLSTVLSEAIIQALEDLECIMNNPKYSINFSYWYEPKQIFHQFKKNEEIFVCEVCFAGSVMVNHLGANSNECLDPYDFPDSENMLRALDCIRQGEINTALRFLNIVDTNFLDRTINSHEYRIFRAQMIEISNELKKAGY